MNTNIFFLHKILRRSLIGTYYLVEQSSNLDFYKHAPQPVLKCVLFVLFKELYPGWAVPLLAGRGATRPLAPQLPVACVGAGLR